MPSNMRAAAVAVLGAIILSGCGVRVFLTGPERARPGAPVTYTLALENPSQCPQGDIETEVIAFLRLGDIEISGDDELGQLLLELFRDLCTGAPFELPGEDFTCRIEDGEIVCEPRNGQSTVGSSQATVSTPQGVLLTCDREGARVTCRRPARGGGASLGSAAQAIMCMPAPEGQLCELDQLAPGETKSTTFDLTAPLQPGVYSSVAIALAGKRGVCKDGPSQGQPCADDADCPLSSPDSCASGICVDDTSGATGAGCDADAECGANESCVECSPDDDAELVLPIACSQLVIGVQAPVTSTWSLAATVMALLALSFYRLRRLRRAGA